jgi:signal transduction histidine kinase/ligand-binding sensor domain-containing protein
MNLRPKQTISYILLSTALVLVLFSCEDKGKPIPFPENKTEFLPPSSEPLRFSEPQKIEWQVNDSTTFERPVAIKVDLASVPSKPFYPDGFIPLNKPMVEMDLKMKQDTVINFKELPSEPIRFKTSMLEPPGRVKAQLPKLNKNASTGIFEFGEDQGLPGSMITALMEDSNGMIWIATDYGICRFDGEYIETFDIIDERFTGAQTIVLSMLEDENGRIWIYTADMGFYVLDLQAGLVRNAFLVETDLRLNLGNAMKKDSRGMIWFGTEANGIFIVDPINGTSKHLPNVTPDGHVNSLEDDGFGKMWIGSNSGLSQIDVESGVLQSIEYKDTFSFDSVTGLFRDDEYNMWVGTNDGRIMKILPGRDKSMMLDKAHGIENSVRHFTEADDDKLWMSSFTGGVYVYDPTRHSLKQLNEENSLISDQVMNSLIDSQGQIWIATDEGINLIDTEGLMPNFLTDDDGLSWPNIWSFMEDAKGDLWLGSWETLDIYSSESNSIKRVDLALQLEKNISIPYEARHMPTGDYLIKVPSTGLALFNPQEETITKITQENGLTHIFQSACLVDHLGKVWTGTFRNGGLEVFNPETGLFKRITNEQGLTGNIVWGITEDALGQIWVGTDLGLNIINVEENTISQLLEGEKIASRNFGAFLRDEEERLWMGSRTGIFIADQKNGLLIKIQPENGLISEEVYTLYKHNEVIYAGTENGLAAIVPPENFATDSSVLDIKSYAKQQGLIFNNFNADAAIAYNDKMWWGIETEVLTVTEIPKRDTVRGKTYISGIAISDELRNFYDYSEASSSYPTLDTIYSAQKDTFYLSTEEPAATGWLSENDIEWEGVEGSYNLPVDLKIPFEQNYVSFQFTGTQLKNRNKTQYSYYLKGFDKSWSDLSAEPFSKNYRSLPAGNYTFSVRSRTFDGVWSEQADFNFTILPHWSNTWWAWLLYILTFIIVVSIIVQYRARALRKENALLEEKVNHRTAQLRKSVDDLKATQAQLVQSEKMASLGELTAGIAHEIQNPLNFVNNFSEVSQELIDEMAEEIENGDLEEVKELSADLKGNLEKITHHGKRADAIVKGMLAHSRSGKGEKSLTDINALAEEYLKLSYHGLRAKDKSFNAEFKTDFDPDLPKINVVPQDIGRVLLNLINNAFQAVNERSKSEGSDYVPLVTIRTELTADSQQLIAISDNGPGIPDNIKDKIFQPFFTTKPAGSGTGLGLSLSYDIVKAHGGEITCQSEEGKGLLAEQAGTEFIITLPS